MAYQCNHFLAEGFFALLAPPFLAAGFFPAFLVALGFETFFTTLFYFFPDFDDFPFAATLPILKFFLIFFYFYYL